jgi:hypothetical protein
MYLVKPKALNRWDRDSIRPGPVGGVGEVNLQPKLRKSAPYLAERYDKTYSKQNEKFYGQNISDGQNYGFSSGGFGAQVIAEGWNTNSSMKTAYGWVHQDIRTPRKSMTAVMTSIGKYSWNEDVANVLKAKVTGDQFLPLPGGYTQPSEDYVTRGSQKPRVTAASVGDGVPLPAADVNVTDAEFGRTGIIPAVGKRPDSWELAPSTIWTPANDSPLRLQPGIFYLSYNYGDHEYHPHKAHRRYPPVGRNVPFIYYNRDGTVKTGRGNFSPWSRNDRPSDQSDPTYIPPRAEPGDVRKKPIPGQRETLPHMPGESPPGHQPPVIIPPGGSDQIPFPGKG